MLNKFPILLRQEVFGGLLFIPGGAVHIELDHEAFHFLKAHFIDGVDPTNDTERQVLEDVLAELGENSIENTKCFDKTSVNTDYPFYVYMSPTLADFQITEYCEMGCPHCYASSTIDGKHVPMDKVEHVLKELSSNGVLQIALGGGEPMSHPNIVEILKLCHSYNLIPNLSTNGLNLNTEKINALKEYCGAVALSMEGVGSSYNQRRKKGFEFFRNTLERFLDEGIETVLQVTLSKENFHELEEIKNFIMSYPKLYGVIFLAYKEVGRGTDFNHTLSSLPYDNLHTKLRVAFEELSANTRVGYDCCLTPGLVGLEKEFQFSQTDQLEGCSALRSSIGILPNLDVAPCTFATDIVVGNLMEKTLIDIWAGDESNSFRGRMAGKLSDNIKCKECQNSKACIGGCPVFDLVNCSSNYLKNK